MTQHTANFLYLGRHASIDTVEGPGNFTDENAGTLLRTYDWHSGAMEVISVTGNDGNGDNVIRSDDNLQTPETFSYQLNGSATSSGLDSALQYNASVLLGDGSTMTTQLWVIQLQNGDVFVNWGGATLSNLSIQTITLTSVVSSNYDGTYANSDSITNLRFVCFVRGTRIDTPAGPRLVERLVPGDRVLTRDHGAQEVIWAAAKRVMVRVPDGAAPVRLDVDALGPGRPARPLVVSGQHRIVLPGGTHLGPACAFLGLAHVRALPLPREMPYHTFALPRHGLVRANGLWAESFWPGVVACSLLTPPDRARLFAVLPLLALFGAAAYGAPALPFLGGDQTRRVLAAGQAALSPG